jgi:anti-sigma regulatory factor (Ser/Thr protein kinase)
MERSISVDEKAVGIARLAVRERLSPHLTRGKLSDAVLLTSELVTNAVRHANLQDADAIRLEVTTQSHAVRVTVIDEGPGFDLDGIRTDRETGGWGLKLVDALSDRWGTQAAPHGVWFELDV